MYLKFLHCLVDFNLYIPDCDGLTHYDGGGIVLEVPSLLRPADNRVQPGMSGETPPSGGGDRLQSARPPPGLPHLPRPAPPEDQGGADSC